jgi:hypothetical protein
MKPGEKEGEGLFEYSYKFMMYTVQGQKFTADCNEIQFINLSANAIIINNNLEIFASTAQNVSNIITLRGQFGEIDRTQYNVTFNTLDISSGTARLCVVRKIYKDPQKVVEWLNKQKK